MKLILFALLVVFTLSPSTTFPQGHPFPPGMRQADQAVEQGERNIPPPAPPHFAPVDLAKLKRDADELASLAHSIPPDIEQVSKGMLPKDMVEKLKRIEKISKHLRGELAP